MHLAMSMMGCHSMTKNPLFKSEKDQTLLGSLCSDLHKARITGMQYLSHCPNRYNFVLGIKCCLQTPKSFCGLQNVHIPGYLLGHSLLVRFGSVHLLVCGLPSTTMCVLVCVCFMFHKKKFCFLHGSCLNEALQI